MSRETEFLHSFLRVDHGDSDSEAGDSPPRVPGSGPAGAQKADEPADGPGGGGGGGGAAAAGRAHHAGDDPPSRRHHKATFKEVVKDLEMYGGLGALAGMRKGAKGRRGRVIRGEEVYTDKDRAAAVQMGHRDIKQSLRMKRHQERVHALQLPEEADGSTLIALGQYELRQGNTDIAIAFVNKALQLCPEDKTALVARSKCYLLLGQPRLALQDAETALEPDRNFVRAIFQKAEALYHMGDFEHSLMYYHRGLRLRPELAVFRLGVQKAQEAIENTIGTGIEESCKIMEEMERAKSGRSGSKGSMRARLASPSSGRHSASGHSSGSAAPSPAPGAAVGGLGPRPAVVTPTADAAADPPAGLAASRVSSPTTPSTLPTQPTLTTPGDASSNAGDEEQSARRLLGELCVDKLYLEQLLRHPGEAPRPLPAASPASCP
ncbi:hypothetical protein ONE63_002818 [Megalurothrips usitatus]|uniref:Outer dynein arm-docking complex subunit 4 n=1 Tax=Megalurothrips usitatus TaxID=439358 RepID=A0AAV7X973_9NEOP|nr:hypothetical protein ONE63_002818 [Megalurothrips usitatus]